MSATRTEVESKLIEEVFEEELSDLSKEQHKSLARQSVDCLIQSGVDIDEDDGEEEESEEDSD